MSAPSPQPQAWQAPGDLRTVVVVGAGQAGVQVAESLRSLGFDGQITLLGAEPYGPYHRPPLSKDWLTGAIEAGQLVLRSPEALQRKGIQLRTGAQVVALRPDRRELELADGEVLGYDGLALATGARPRRLSLPGADAPGIAVLRTRDDATAVAEGLDRCVATGRPLVVVGGGFVGLEVAAAARHRGIAVTVLEAQPRLLARALAEPLSDWYAGLHAGHGVELLLGTGVAGFESAGGAATGVRITDGRVLPAGMVLLGVGADPDDALARAAGLDCERGIVVDDCGRTSAPAVVAAGDCTVTRLADGTVRRLESVQNAVEQGKAAAAALLGLERPFTGVPWFWSRQYDVQLQLAGLADRADRWELSGDLNAPSFTLYGFRDAELVCAQSVNAPSDHLEARRTLAGAAPARPGPRRPESPHPAPLPA
ncbi:MAG TPA: FAD-dependent oxidoreductase [Kineosporiaceae bacterium]|nr:FAD-dependent oxidoreductase [Kineosporiaceae bacterium]